MSSLFSRNTPEYKQGARKFVDTVQASLGNPEKIRCPCISCRNGKRHNYNIVYDHLIVPGINPLYTKWIFHGEETTSAKLQGNVEIPETYRMLKDACFEDDDVQEPTDRRHVPDYENLLEEAELPIYTGSTWTKMSATVACYKFKARHSLSNTGFDELLEMIHSFLPKDNILPNSLYSTKKLLKAFDLGYEKIHACVRDCCLFRKELEHAVHCPHCGASRWKVDKHTKKIHEGIPVKVLRYFPVIPRFRRMFKNAEMAEQLTWHDTNKSQDGMMRHLD